MSFTAAGAEEALGATLQPATVGIARSDEVTFDAAAGTYSYWGAWSAVTSGTFRLGNTILPASQTPAEQAQINHSIGVGAVSGA